MQLLFTRWYRENIGNELIFPGSGEFYNKAAVFTDASLHARFCRWVSLEPNAANQVLNITNGDVESWMNRWPRVAEYFGLSVPPDQFLRPAPLASETPLHGTPPLSIPGNSVGLEGRSSQSYIRTRVNLVQWARTKEVREAWNRVSEREGLDPTALDKATWWVADFCWGRDYNIVLSMSKARKLGWTGYLESWDSLRSIFDVLKREQIIPK